MRSAICHIEEGLDGLLGVVLPRIRGIRRRAQPHPPLAVDVLKPVLEAGNRPQVLKDVVLHDQSRGDLLL